MVDINELYASSSSLLRTEDLKGRRVKVKIVSWRTQEFKDKFGKQKEKLVLAFEGKEKEFVCNPTNALMIAARLTSESEDWVGKEIELYPDKTSFEGKIVDCIKVSVPMPIVAEEDDEAVPF